MDSQEAFSHADQAMSWERGRGRAVAAGPSDRAARVARPSTGRRLPTVSRAPSSLESSNALSVTSTSSGQRASQAEIRARQCSDDIDLHLGSVLLSHALLPRVPRPHGRHCSTCPCSCSTSGLRRSAAFSWRYTERASSNSGLRRSRTLRLLGIVEASETTPMGKRPQGCSSRKTGMARI
jgi:hypothetical protein